MSLCEPARFLSTGKDPVHKMEPYTTFSWRIMMQFFLSVVFVGFFGWTVANESLFYGYKLDRDLDAVLNRARLATSADEMLKYLKIYRSNLEKHGAASGHTVLSFKTLNSDLAAHYQSINKVIHRLE